MYKTAQYILSLQFAYDVPLQVTPVSNAGSIDMRT